MTGHKETAMERVAHQAEINKVRKFMRPRIPDDKYKVMLARWKYSMSKGAAKIWSR